MIDPRTKLSLCLIGLGILLLSTELILLLVECGILVLLVLILKEFKTWIRSLRLIFLMVGFVFLVSAISFDVLTSIHLSIRLLSVVTLFFVFFQTTIPEDLGSALRSWGIPYEFVFMLTSGMRYVPHMARKIRDIMDAQRSRGIDLELRIRNVKNFLALLAPLLTQSFVMAEDLAMAMESRGFGCPNRTSIRTYRMSVLDYAIISTSMISFVLFIFYAKL